MFLAFFGLDCFPFVIFISFRFRFTTSPPFRRIIIKSKKVWGRWMFVIKSKKVRGRGRFETFYVSC